LAVACAILIALLLAACTGEGSGVIPPPSPDFSVREATFVYTTGSDVIDDWDPATAYGNEIIALQNIYETLTVYNPVTRKAGPRLAISWRSSADRRTWTFRLRPNVRFHTGRPLDAEAVRQSIERTRRLGGPAAYIWDPVQSITAEDPTTVVFQLSRPAPLDLIASSGYAAYIYDTAAAGSGDLKRWFASGRDAGSGPYTIAEWNEGKVAQLTLRAFDDYWGGWDGPRYRNVVFRVEPDQESAWRRLVQGEVNFLARVTPPYFRRAENTPGVRSVSTQSFQNLLLLFNTASGPLRNRRLRRAVQLAIDYRGVVDALDGAVAPATGLVPPGLVGHVRDRRPRQNLTQAARLLAQAGYGPGRRPLRLTLTYAAGDADQRLLVRRLAVALRRLNVRLEARALSWQAQLARARAKEPERRQDIFVMYWRPDYADAYSWYRNLFHGDDPSSLNFAYLKDEKTDERIDALPSLFATDRTAAQKAYADLQTRLVDELAVVAVPWVVVHQRAYLGGVRGYTDNPAYPNVVFVHSLTPRG
jgi:peptide/nickel transport system substrate-binding protein